MKTQATVSWTCTLRVALGVCSLSTYERGEGQLCYWHRKEADAAAMKRRPERADPFTLLTGAA